MEMGSRVLALVIGFAFHSYHLSPGSVSPIGDEMTRLGPPLGCGCGEQGGRGKRVGSSLLLVVKLRRRELC